MCIRDFKVGRDSFSWEVSYYSLYSLDLIPSDFKLFNYFKHYFGGNHYNDEKVVKTVFNCWLSKKATSFFEEVV